LRKDNAGFPARTISECHFFESIQEAVLVGELEVSGSSPVKQTLALPSALEKNPRPPGRGFLFSNGGTRQKTPFESGFIYVP